jgi:SAM-dependent methyltransferase
MAPIHDRLIGALAPRRNESFLDVATGTGAVALRAARAGADVTAIDIAPALIEIAKRKAADDRLSIRFEVGDAQALPFADASFNVVSSAHGVHFAADHAATASELGRVCRPEGRLGITVWRRGGRGDDFAEMVAWYEPAPAGPSPGDWGSPEYATRLLCRDFELEFVPEVWMQTGESGDAIWRLITEASPQFKALVESLSAEGLAAFRAEWVAYYEQYRDGGVIRAPNEYMLILGRRR